MAEAEVSVDAGAKDAGASAGKETVSLTGEQGGEQKAAEQAAADTNKQAEGKDAEKQTDEKDAKAAEIPTKYELKLPEGVLIDDGLMDKFTKEMQAIKADNATAQKFADLHLEAIGVALQKQADAWTAEETKKVETWVGELKADKDLQGVNEAGVAKIDATLNDARKVLNALGSPDEVKKLKADLDASGLNCHPMLIKGLAKFAHLIGDDNMVIGAPSAKSEKTAAQVLYPNS